VSFSGRGKITCGVPSPVALQRLLVIYALQLAPSTDYSTAPVSRRAVSIHQRYTSTGWYRGSEP